MQDYLVYHFAAAERTFYWDFDLFGPKLQLPFVEWWNPRSRGPQLWRQFSNRSTSDSQPSVFPSWHFKYRYWWFDPFVNLTNAWWCIKIGPSQIMQCLQNRRVSVGRPVISAPEKPDFIQPCQRSLSDSVTDSFTFLISIDYKRFFRAHPHCACAKQQQQKKGSGRSCLPG